MSPFSKTQEGSVATFTVESDFTQNTNAGLRQSLLDAIKDGATTIKVDLHQADRIDSPSIGLLVAAHNSLKNSSGELIIVRAKPQIVELFAVLQLDKRFKVNPA